LTSNEAPASESRLNLGQSRRLGLGPPFQRPPAGLEASEEIAGEEAPATRAGETAAEALETPSPVQAMTADLADDAGEVSPAVATPPDVPPQAGAPSSVGEVRVEPQDRPP